MKTTERCTMRSVSSWVLLAAILAQPALVAARTILPAGRATTWKYLDTAVEPGATWRDIDYDDAAWKSGPAPLGFGESAIVTAVHSGPDNEHRPITTWFRHAFDGPKLAAGESLVVSTCIDDGAIFYLNGQEIGRANMPAGPVQAATPALKTIGNDREGFYQRLRVPAKLLRAGQKNVLAVEVHQASANSSDLFFDLALKVVPADAESVAPAAAREVVELYNQRHFVGPDVKIPDGYIDGGRRMKLDAGSGAVSGREILMVDRSRDKPLADDLAFARSPELKALPTLERIQRLAARIDREMTPPGGLRWVDETTEQLEAELTNKPVLIGEWLDQCQAGVCRHRALLFKILADEAGLHAALVRGNFASKGPPGFPHAWNEVTLDDGQRVIVDIMHHGGKAVFPPITDPSVIRRYLKVDGTSWYGDK
jgi:hypothetical protein